VVVYSREAFCIGAGEESRAQIGGKNARHSFGCRWVRIGGAKTEGAAYREGVAAGMNREGLGSVGANSHRPGERIHGVFLRVQRSLCRRE
jgi:hypothetical protein